MNGQSANEERFNSIIHLLGTIAALIGLVVLIRQQTDPWRLVSFSLFGSAMVLLYGTSALYHAIRGKAKRVLRKLDHLAIYILIAGTYTPFALVTLRETWGWPMFGIVWGLAIVGIVVDLLPNRSGRRAIPMVIYLSMGWLALLVAKPLFNSLSPAGFIWLLCGGLCYTGGLVFYRFDGKIRYFHAIWHLFVLFGSVFHFFAIYLYVA